MGLQGVNGKSIFQQAKKFMPYGVNSNFRYWGDDDTLVIKKGQGAYIWDVDDKRYIDYRLGFGPVILGHAYPAVVQKVQQAIEGGTCFALTTPLEIEVTERIIRMCGVEKVRLTNTGSEATFHALRIARAHTGREKYIKFEGQYHGVIDYFMFSTSSTPGSVLGSRKSPLNVAASSGIPKGISEYVISLPFNDIDILERTVKAKWGEIAAIFIEPMMGNCAGVMPKIEFLLKARQLCDEYGIVLMFDEVKTGFRLANGGAQQYFDIKADLATYAKSLGNGFPIAAIGGTEDVMMTIQPGALMHGGTYSGNVVGTAAAAATLEVLETQPVIETINQRGKRLMEGISAILSRQGITHYMTGVPSAFCAFLGSDKEPLEYRDYLNGSFELYEAIGRQLVSRGVMPDPDPREPWFLCYALSESDVDETLNIYEDAVKAVTA